MKQISRLAINLALLLLVLCAGLTAQEPAKEKFARDYQAYLGQKFPAEFKSIIIGPKKISIEVRITKGKRHPADQLAIAILPEHIPSQRPVVASQVHSASLVKKGSKYKTSVERFLKSGKDLSHYRFVLIQREGSGGFKSLTAPTYANEWGNGVQRKLKRLVGRDRKGLGGIPNDSARKDHQIYELGLSHATINIVLNALIRPKPTPGFQKWKFEGRDVYLNEKRLVQYDQRLERMRQEDIVASMILLISNQRDKNGRISSPLVHPEAEPDGKFVMPDLATPAGAFFYRAIISHLAERFTREGSKSGRVTNWIMHNEIDQSGVWTNMGVQPIERYMEVFTRSARLVHHITRKYDPNSRVFVSLTHYWNRISKTKSAYRVRDIIEFFARASVVEGDFEWGIAYHPYPTNLREPRTWNDKSVQMNIDTPLITPRNIEVLPAWLDQRRLRYLGKHERAILLSEQGCSAQSTSLQDQQIQAAGIVYMFSRMRQLPTVEAFHYHAYRDSPTVEGGARFGLVDENEKPKFAWKVYQSLNTAREGRATEFAWAIMGREASRHANRRQKVVVPP